MLPNRIVTVHILLLFCILDLLQYVSGYVAQPLNTIAELVPISSFVTSNSSSAAPINSAATNLSQEEPPLDFRVEYIWKAHGATFGRFDFLDTVILNTASMALQDWSSNVPAHKFPSSYNIAFGFVSNRSGPGFMIKHIIWALEEIFNIILRHDDYSSGNVIVDLGSIRLGVGNVYDTLADSAPVNPSATLVGRFAGASIGGSILSSTTAPSNDRVLDKNFTLPAYKPGNISTIQTPLLSQISDSSVDIKAHGNVQLHYRYRTDGAIIDDAQVYNSTLKLLIKAAEPPDKKGIIWPGLSTYNVVEDFTFTLRPSSFETRMDVSWFDAIFALSTIPVMMSKHGGAPGKFGEIIGIMTIGTTVVGRFCMDKGDKTALDFMDVCNVDNQDSGNGEDGVATA